MTAEGAKFTVEDTFVLHSRTEFVLVGDVLAGAIRPGMHVGPPGAGPTKDSWVVVGVDFVDTPAEGRHHVGLRLKYATDQELRRLEATVWKGATVQVRAC